MSDIVERLRLLVPSDSSGAAFDAVDEITALRAALSTARADALEEAAKVAELSWYAPNVMYYSDDDERLAKSCAFEAAAAIRALKESKGE